MRLLYKLILLISIVAAVPVFAVSVINYVFTRQTVVQDRIDRLEIVNELRVAEMDRWLETNKRSLREMAQRPLIRQYVAVLVAAPDRIESRSLPEHTLLHTDHLDVFIEEDKGFFELFVMTPDEGFTIISTDAAQFGKLHADENYFQMGKHETYIQNIYFSASHNQSLITIATPIVNNNGETIGVLGGHVNLNELSRIMLTGTWDETQETYLVNESNTIVTSSDLATIDHSNQLRSVFSEGIDNCLQGQWGSGIYTGPDGESVLGVYRWLADSNLCMITEIAESEALVATVTVRNTAVVLGIAAIIIALFSASILARSLTRPIVELVSGTEEIGRNNLDYRIQVHGQDEIAQLAASFNTMTENLGASIEEMTHGHHLMNTVTAVAPAIHGARTPQEIYTQLGKALDTLGLSTAVFSLTADQTHFKLSYLNAISPQAKQGIALLGIETNTSQFQPVENGLIQNVIDSNSPLFASEIAPLLSEIVPDVPDTVKGKIFEYMAAEQAIVLLLHVNKTLHGLLVVVGNSLRKTDVPVFELFASKIGVALQNTLLIDQLRHSERKFRALANDIADGVAVTVDGKNRWVNRAFANMFGFKPAEMIGKGLDLVFPQPSMAEIRERMRSNGRLLSADFDVPAMQKDGTVIFVEVITKEMPFEGEQGVQLVVHDVTERKKVMTALQQHQEHLEQLVTERATELKVSEARYRALAESSPDMVFLVDRDDTVVYVNKLAAVQFGKEVNKIVGRPLTELFPPEIATHQLQALHDTAQLGKMVESESKMTFPDREVWLDTRLVPMKGDAGEVTAVLGISRDITNLKEIEFTLAQKASDLENSNIELRRFAYVASHDLQEPLRMVTSFLDLLVHELGTDLSEDAKLYIDYAVDGAERMSGLIKDLLEFSRVTNNQSPFVTVDFEDVLAQTLSNLDIVIHEKEAVITHDSLPTVSGDKNQLTRLLQNLINNAIKFNSTGAPKIHVTVQDNGENYLFGVRDNGIGIDPKYQDRIFVIFQRLHSREEFEGTGIGLAICKKIAERHGGEIWYVPNEDEEGTTFFFTIAK